MPKTYTYPSPSKAIHSTKIDLSKKININSSARNKSEKSFSKIKDNELTDSKESKVAKLKTLKILTQNKVPQQKLMTPPTTKLLQKHSAKSRIKIQKVIPQTI